MTYAVVTGASRGIGRATALALAERGVDMALLGRPSPALERTASDCAEHGALVHTVACDLERPEQIAAAAAGVERSGPPDVVINNAGVLERGRPVHEIDPDEWERVLAVNLRAPFLLDRALLPRMLARGSGRLIHVASLSATIGCPLMAHYCASKWGLLGLSKTLAEELRGTGLLSVAILPGSVDTDMLRRTPFDPVMSASEVAAVIVYYALDAPPAVNGAAVEVFG